MAHIHIGEMVLERARRSPTGTAFRVRKGEAYADVAWRDVLPRIENVAAGLLSIPGGLEHAAAVTIIGNTSLDWIV